MPPIAPLSSEPQSVHRVPDAAAAALSETLVVPTYERVDLDRYAVIDGAVVGFVDVVAPVFVCYLGATLAHAVEIAQVHDFHVAVETVLRASADGARRSA